jgi:hypothetical protein
MDVQTHRGNLIMNTATMAYRNLLKTFHNPDRMMDVIVQPIMFMLMFGYLFGGAIAGNVQNYLPTIVPGNFDSNNAFGIFRFRITNQRGFRFWGI